MADEEEVKDSAKDENTPASKKKKKNTKKTKVSENKNNANGEGEGLGGTGDNNVSNPNNKSFAKISFRYKRASRLRDFVRKLFRKVEVQVFTSAVMYQSRSSQNEIFREIEFLTFL